MRVGEKDGERGACRRMRVWEGGWVWGGREAVVISLGPG